MIFRILLYVGVALLLPGLCALGYSVWEGPLAWHTDLRTFWGVPISLFVFWIGIAHAGTLISAILLALGVRLDRRTSLIAELTTLCALVVAAIFPLMHLGQIENFYMVIPFLDARGTFANLRSPLVWDFCCIAVYAVLSLAYFLVHLFSERFKPLEELHRPMAWILFPLVFWVHTIVSLDFAVTFVPEWQGAFFPLYFIAGAIYSGLAMVNAILVAEGCRVRLLEKLMVSCSFFMLVFWAWNFALKGEWNFSVFAFGFLIPQLWWVSFVRETPFGRFGVSLSVLVGLWLERFFLVMPSGTSLSGYVDAGLVAFSVGLFVVLFAALRIKLRKPIEGDELLFGELDQVSVLQKEPQLEPVSNGDFFRLRLPLLLGTLVALIYVLWAVSRPAFETTALGLMNVAPLVYPIVALVASFALCSRTVWNIARDSRAAKVTIVLFFLALGGLAGAFYAGGSSVPSCAETRSAPVPAESADAVPAHVSGNGSAENPIPGVSPEVHAQKIWESRCAACHGADGRFNEKFIREFYPVPQKLTAGRLDSLGIDSLVSVILHGRSNMNPYEGRLSEAQARSLVLYMRSLAPSKPETPPSKPEKSTEEQPEEVLP